MSEKSAKRILIVSAHPDDEVLGCGGTVARHCGEGDEVYVLILAEGASSRAPLRDREKFSGEIEALRVSAENAARCLGTRPPRFSGMADNRMDSLDLLEVVKDVEGYVQEIRPEIVYTHHGGDLNVDHRMTHQAVLTACRPLPGAPIRAIYSFESLSSTEWAGGLVTNAFVPNRFVDIGVHLEKKMEALKCYSSEMRPFPHPRSYEGVRALALLRGTHCGAAAAEAFHVNWEIL